MAFTEIAYRQSTAVNQKDRWFLSRKYVEMTGTLDLHGEIFTYRDKADTNQQNETKTPKLPQQFLRSFFFAFFACSGNTCCPVTKTA